MVVQSLDKADKERYLVEVAEGDKGYLVTRGQNLMSGYVHGEEATRKYVAAYQ
jgi:long-subunit acyl-CoA synthetase (AMP-forming)